MKKGEKLVFSFLVALVLPWIIALFLNIFVREPVFLVVTGVMLSAYTLIGGFQKNGELEVTIGALFGQLTGWVIPPGYSWWFPRPFGQSLRPTNIGLRELNRRKSDGKHLTQVETSDNNQVEVSYYILYEIVRPDRWVLVEKPTEALEAAVDRCVRWFVNMWPTDEIANRKEDVSNYVMGKPVCVHKVDAHGEPIGNEKEKEVASDIVEVLLNDLGVKLISSRIDDINPPESYIKAREKEAVEDSERRREAKNADALVEQIEKIKATGVSPDAALDGALITRGDAEAVVVKGNAGDFTKGAAVQSRNKRNRR